MHRLLKAAAITIALVGVSLTTACAEDGGHRGRTQMNVGVSFDFGDVAYGYRDGYWDHQHRWHNWQHRDDAGRYRSAPNNQYHDWDHTREPDQGWHDGGDSHR